ncbi:MAG TPA: hypothetical protein VFL79_18105 [Terriglobia bacterium]|nr:hypothetical protein [Terriglobia bacterium]
MTLAIPPLHAATNDFLLTPEKAGVIKIGMSIDEVYLKVSRKHTKLVDISNEGFFTPTLQIFLPGDSGSKPSVEVEIVCRCGPAVPTAHPPPWYVGTPWAVGDITVYDPKFHTARGIHVGSSLGELRKKYSLKIYTGEGRVSAIVRSLRMGFGLDTKRIPQVWYRTHIDTLIPDDTKIILIGLQR